MKYKPGDKVKINVDSEDMINFHKSIIKIVLPDRVATIYKGYTEVYEDYEFESYKFKELHFRLFEHCHIECLVKEEIYKPIHSRFEILDL